MFQRKQTGFTPLKFFRSFFGVKENNQKTLTGFTLIELLVVISIIGVLASITMVSMNNIRSRARDDRRVADMKAFRDALALYQIQNISYPSEPDGAVITGTDTLSQALIGEKLLSGPIIDPTNTGQYVYTYRSLLNDSTYAITFCMETSSLNGYTQDCNNAITP